jgi:hypothetical protein
MHSADLADVAPIGRTLPLPEMADPISDHIPVPFLFRKLRATRYQNAHIPSWISSSSAYADMVISRIREEGVADIPDPFRHHACLKTLFLESAEFVKQECKNRSCLFALPDLLLSKSIGR